MTPKSMHNILTALQITTLAFMLSVLYMLIDMHHMLTGRWLPW